MPVIKYRTNNEKINEVMVDSNTTVSDFMDIVNKKSKDKITTSIFRGKILKDDDLIRNYITDPDDVLTLLTDNSGAAIDIMDLEDGVGENKRKKEAENKVSSSLFLRSNNNVNRRGLNFTFTIFTTATTESMLHGDKMNFSLNYNYSKIYDEIKNLVSKFPQIDKDFDIHLFLPGGVHYKSKTLLDYYINPDNIAFDHIYVIVTKNAENSYSIDDEIKEPCDCSTSPAKEILSPNCKSSSSGLSQIAAFLGYMFHSGLNSEHILLVLAKITRFAPLVVNLYRLIQNKPLNALNILAITAPLFTLFRSMLPEKVKNENVFEYTLNFLSLFEAITNTEYLKFFEIDTKNEKDCTSMKPFANYCKNTEQQQHVIVWTADTINPDFQAVLMKPTFETITNIFSQITTFKPVAPLTLHYIFYPTFVRGNEDGKSVMLFIKEVPDKDNVVSIINPNEGKIKEVDIEELARQVNCEKKEDIFTLINPNQVDQIIFICFDESMSMKWKMEGGNPHRNENTRAFVASEFLKTLVKQSYALRVSSFYGLISFSSEVKVQQHLNGIVFEQQERIQDQTKKW